MIKKEKNFEKLPYRNGVGIIVLNNENKIFVAKRIDNPKNFWQMPQGGVDKGENYYDAALRELKEETSIVSVELIQEIERFNVEIVKANKKATHLDKFEIKIKFYQHLRK